jgi:hypothetical protein
MIGAYACYEIGQKWFLFFSSDLGRIVHYLRARFCSISLGIGQGSIVTCNNDEMRLDSTRIFKKARKALMHQPETEDESKRVDRAEVT